MQDSDIPRMKYKLTLTLDVDVMGDQQAVEEHLIKMLTGAVYSTRSGKLKIENVEQEK